MIRTRARALAPWIIVAILDLAGLILVGGQHKAGWGLWAAGLVCLVFAERPVRRDLVLLYGSTGLLGLTPISTNTSLGHFAAFGALLGLALLAPYLISRYGFRDHHIHFQWHHGRGWYKSEIAYIGLTALVAYLLLPFMMRTSGSYLHWSVGADASSLLRLFIGTNALGIWDELFFICTVLGLLRRHLPFPAANLAQAVLFTSFLYELGFRGWAAGVIFGFALIQGYVFKQTESLLYVITIHLVADFILYLVLVHAYHPAWLPIFVT